jgi:hypothetical protein
MTKRRLKRALKKRAKRTQKQLSAAALKAWATRRKLAQVAKGLAQGRAAVRVSGARLRADATEEAYITRVTTAIERTTRAGDNLRCAAQVGKDMGGGWLVLVTDGFRALTRKATGDQTAEAIARPITTADPPVHGLTCTPELEGALRTLRRGLDRKRPEVRIAIDKRRQRVTLTAGAETLVVPAVGDVATARVTVNLPWLLDGFGRGGRLGYTVAHQRAGCEAPLMLDTPDGLRYVVMPAVAP